MGYELRVERESPLGYADLTGVLPAGFELRGTRESAEDGESYGIRDGIVEQVNGSAVHEFGKLEEILAAGPAQWSM